MTWVKLDDQFFANPKVLELSKDAKLLYLGGLTHCASQLTDGHISPAALRVVCALVDVDKQHANELVDAGLWRKRDDGFEVNDYLEYNPAAKQVKARRKANAQRQARYRERQQERDDDDTEDVSDGATKDSSNAVSNGVTNEDVTLPVTRPRPVPSRPTTSKHTSSEKTAAADKPPQNPEQPHGIAMQFVELLGTDPDDVKPKWLSKQRGAAKNMLNEGYTADEIIGCARFMQSQSWRTNPFDLTDVHARIGTWVASGRPEYEPARKQQRKESSLDVAEGYIANLRRESDAGRDHRDSTDAYGQGTDGEGTGRLGSGMLEISDSRPWGDS